jgi:hypothetical protein
VTVNRAVAVPDDGSTTVTSLMLTLEQAAVAGSGVYASTLADAPRPPKT